RGVAGVHPTIGDESQARVGSGSESIAKHRQAALRLGFCYFVLQDVPVFSETAVLDPDNIRGDPRNRRAVSRETSVDNDIVALRDDELVFVTQGLGRIAD